MARADCRLPAHPVLPALQVSRAVIHTDRLTAMNRFPPRDDHVNPNHHACPAQAQQIAQPSASSSPDSPAPPSSREPASGRSDKIGRGPRSGNEPESVRLVFAHVAVSSCLNGSSAPRLTRKRRSARHTPAESSRLSTARAHARPPGRGAARRTLRAQPRRDGRTSLRRSVSSLRSSR